MQKSIFAQKFQKSLSITTKSLYTNFKRNYLENYNDSEDAVKTKNAPFFMIFPNISFFHMVVTYCTGPLKVTTSKFIASFGISSPPYNNFKLCVPTASGFTWKICKFSSSDLDFDLDNSTSPGRSSLRINSPVPA